MIRETKEFGYLRLLSCRVNSLISSPESLREDKVPGTSSETTCNNLFIEAANLAKAYPSSNKLVKQIALKSSSCLREDSYIQQKTDEKTKTTNSH